MKVTGIVQLENAAIGYAEAWGTDYGLTSTKRALTALKKAAHSYVKECMNKRVAKNKNAPLKRKVK